MLLEFGQAGNQLKLVLTQPGAAESLQAQNPPDSKQHPYLQTRAPPGAAVKCFCGTTATLIARRRKNQL